MKGDSFVFYTSDYQSINGMTDAQLGRLMRGIFEYVINGIENFEDPELKYVHKLLIDKIKRDQEKYEKVCMLRSQAGKKGNDKRWKSQRSQSIATIADCEYVNESESVIIEIKKIFLFEKRVLPVINEYERFYQHYEKNNWLDGNGIPITNKIACARNWEVPEAKKTLLQYQAVAWHKIYSKLSREPNCDLLITDLVKIEVKNVTLTITCTSAMRDFLEKHIENVKDIVHSDFKCQYLEYAP